MSFRAHLGNLKKHIKQIGILARHVLIRTILPAAQVDLGFRVKIRMEDYTIFFRQGKPASTTTRWQLTAKSSEQSSTETASYHTRYKRVGKKRKITLSLNSVSDLPPKIVKNLLDGGFQMFFFPNVGTFKMSFSSSLYRTAQVLIQKMPNSSKKKSKLHLIIQQYVRWVQISPTTCKMLNLVQ